ncbi:hypothetical protein LTR96_006265 [Exophiala xenobiotica]|nr:hypothetical protein LTR96_006265 [Exophiala xenobiotica]KAK5292902.1 hypothetical protein LTR14_005251 [Exophiala xenobiotica]
MLAGVELDEWTVVLPTRQNTTLGESLWFGTGHKGKEWVSDLVPEDGTVCSWCGKPEHKGDFTSCTGELVQHEDINLKENQIATASTGDEPDEAVALDLAVSTGAPAGRKFSDARLASQGNSTVPVVDATGTVASGNGSKARESFGHDLKSPRAISSSSRELRYRFAPELVRAIIASTLVFAQSLGLLVRFSISFQRIPTTTRKVALRESDSITILDLTVSTHLPSTDIVDVTDTPPLGPPGPELTVTSMDQFLATQSAEQQLEHAKNLRAFFVQVAANFDVELISMREILDNITEFMIIQTVDQRQTHIIDLRAYLKKLLADQDPQLADKLFPDVMDEDGVDTDTAVDDEVDDGDEDYDPDNENGQVKSKVTNMLPPPRTFMTSPDDRRLSRQGRQLWMYDYGVARLKDQKMDWLSQTGTIMDFWPLGHIVTAAPMKSDWEMWRDLATLAINAFGTPFQSDRESVRILWPNRACGTSGCDDTKQHTRAF